MVKINQYHVKGLPKRFYFNNYNAGFCPQTPKLEPSFKTSPMTLGVTEIRKVETCISALRLALHISKVRATFQDFTNNSGSDRDKESPASPPSD